MSGTRVVFSCDGDYSVTGDGAVACAGTWMAQVMPAPFDISQIDPTVWWGHFGAGFMIIASFFVMGRKIKAIIGVVK
ncbi:Uncharacterised protein [Pseudomonas luteola]|uniref:Uncharacterized protein n=1 Tax=Pseudomonas luteola TaxID=47886 RepID=A0A2X2F846_PSELU|nr:hypothetical protein [Pseudomonas luteola]SPZ16889.1 Uncharacterised protein [Pseudomonas luteola]